MTSQPAAQVQPIVEPKSPLVPLTVAAHVLANTVSAVGLTALCIGIALAAGVEFDAYRWAGIVGLCWWGAINWFRFAHDELRMAIIEADRILLRRRVEELDAENDALDAILVERDRTIARQAAQIANKRNFVTSQPDRLSPRMNDAIALVRWKYGDGIEVTQRWAQREKAWSTKRYGDAMQVLGAAKIVAGEGNAIKWAKYDSPAVALIALDGITLDDSIFASNQSSGEGGE